MNKNAIKKFAIEARKKLIDSVTDKAGMLGITEKSCSEPITKGADFEVYQTVAGTEVTLNKRQCEQRRRLVSQIESRGFEAVVEEVAKDYEDVTYEHMLVDNCAMQLVNNPRQFDVILTENMFGDILSDEASMITGSIGMLSSASLAEGKFGLYEPSHGSAPDIAGQDIANPIATILSAAMMLRYSFDLDKEADEIEKAVKAVLADGYRTVDIMSDGMKKVGCKEMGQLIIDQIK